MPSTANMLPSIIGGAVVPLTVYYLVRHHVHTDADALIIAGIFPAAWIVLPVRAGASHLRPGRSGRALRVRRRCRRSTLLGGNAYVLKVRDGCFTALLGIACIVSVFAARSTADLLHRPHLSAGNDRRRWRRTTSCTTSPGGRTRSGCSPWSGGWAGGEALVPAHAGRLPAHGTLPGRLAVHLGRVLGGMFLFTVRYANRAARRRAAP